MSNKREELNLDLSNKRLKTSEFILGILVGLVGSVIIESIFKIITITIDSLWWYIYGSIATLFILFIWYKRIVGFPDYVEYSCKISQTKKFELEDFNSLLNVRLIKNLKKHGYRSLYPFTWRWDLIFRKFRNYSASHLGRTRWGGIVAYIYFFRKEQKFIFLIGIPSIFYSTDKIVNAFKDTMKDFEKRDVINNNWKFSRPKYYHASLWSPFKKKGKEVK